MWRHNTIACLFLIGLICGFLLCLVVFGFPESAAGACVVSAKCVVPGEGEGECSVLRTEYQLCGDARFVCLERPGELEVCWNDAKPQG